MRIDQRALAADAGMVPLENPTDTQLQILSRIAADCESVYEPLPGDARLAGWYLYQQTEQATEQRESDGVCSINDDLIAVIGLSAEMLERSGEESPYPRIVGLHELAHLSEAAHNENFSRRLMGLENALFSSDDDIDRIDGLPFRYDCRPYNPYATAKLVRHDSAPFTPAAAYARLTGGSAEAARRQMLDRQGIGPKSERTSAQARAEMIERGAKRNTKKLSCP